MSDLVSFLKDHGWPGWLAALIAGAWFAVDKLHLWPRHGKSEREILSADELTFRKDLMARLAEYERRLDECMKAHTECREANGRLDEKMQTLVRAAAAAGIKFAVEISPVAPVPGVSDLMRGA